MIGAKTKRIRAVKTVAMGGDNTWTATKVAMKFVNVTTAEQARLCKVGCTIINGIKWHLCRGTFAGKPAQGKPKQWS